MGTIRTGITATPAGWRVLYLMLLALIPGGVWVASAPHATAAHPFPGRQYHSFRIHSTDYNEEVCVNSSASAPVDHDSARDRILDTLKFAQPSADWHRVNDTNHIYIIGYATPCRQMSAADYDDMEFRYFVNDDAESADGCYAEMGLRVANCAYGRDAVFTCAGGDPCHTDYYHRHVRHGRTVIYDSDGTLESRHRIINHEAGHSLGLADPGPCTDNSIMHLVDYCPGNTPYVWPRAADHTSVEDNVYHRNIP